MKLLTEKCPHCDKKITSLYPEQLDYNMKNHLMKHEKEAKEKQEVKGKNG